MQLHGQAAVGALEFGAVGAAWHPENFVVILFVRHG
jgi:hypothetical protein